MDVARPRRARGGEDAVGETALVALDVLELHVRPVERHRPARRQGHLIVLFGRFEVGQHHAGAGLVAGRQEARQRQFREQRGAHRHGPFGVAEAIHRPGHRHEAEPAAEIRDVEGHAAVAVRVELHRTAEQRHGLESLDVEPAHLELGPRVATLDELPGLPIRIDEAAVNVAQLETGHAAAEVMVGGIGAGKIRHAQHGLVNGRERHIGGLAAGRARRREGDVELGAGLDGVGSLDGDAEFVGGRGACHPGDPDGTHRQARQDGAGRSHGDGQHVGARRRNVGRVELNRSAALRHFDLPHLMQAVAVEHHEDAAREARLDAGPQPTAGRVRIERHRQDVGLAVVGGRFAPPAGAEPQGRRGLAGRVEDFEAETAARHRNRQMGVPVRAEREFAAVHPAVVDHLLGLPAPVAEIGRVVVILLDEVPGEAAGADRLAGAVHQNDVKTGLGALGQASPEHGSNPDEPVGGAQRPGQLGRRGAAIDVVDGGAQGEFEWTAGVERADRGQHHARPPFVVCGEGLGVERFRQERLLHEPEPVARQALEGRAGRLDRRLHLAGQRAAGAAVEIIRLHRRADRPGGVKETRRQVELGLETRGHEILHRHRGGAEAFLAARPGPDRPFAVVGVVGNVDVERAAARPREVRAKRVHLDAVGPDEVQRHRRRGGGARLGVAQQGAEVDRFAGPVNAPVGPQEGVERPGRGAPFQVEVGEVQRGRVEPQPGIIAPWAGRRKQLGGVPVLTPQQAARNHHAAVGIRLEGNQHVVAAGDQPDGDVGHRPGAFQRPGAHQQARLRLDGEEADVGHAEPLGGPFGVVVERFSVRHGGRHVDAGLQRLDELPERQRGGDLLVGLGGNLHPAFEHLAGMVGDLRQPRSGLRLAEPVAAHLVGQAPLADAVKHQMGLGDVDAAQRQADPLGVGQQRLVAGKADARLPIGHVDLDRDVPGQNRRVSRRQAGLQPDLVMLAVLQARDAQVLAARLHGVVDRGVDRNEGVERAGVAPRQGARERQAGRRNGAVGLNRHVEVVDRARRLGHRQRGEHQNGTGNKRPANRFPHGSPSPARGVGPSRNRLPWCQKA